ncbi:uncharacterized protein [Antedon mediterranea]|uniref:uncharacterized protein n=1 Tax=Antedon mediterranea TaxID=105859 RepID=UPI003AF4F3D2
MCVCCCSQKMAFLNNSLKEQVEQVYHVCPDVSKDDIRRDLSITSNVEETINRIFDGNFLNGFIEELQKENNTRNIDNNYGIDRDDDDDLKDLPDIKIHSLKSTETRKLKRQLTDRETSSVKFVRTHAEFSVENIAVSPTKLNCGRGKTPDRRKTSDRQTITVSDNKFKQKDILANIDLTRHPSEMSAVYNSDHRGSPISLSSSDDESNNTIELLNRIRGQRAKVTDNNNRANVFDIASISYKKPSEGNYEDYRSSEQFSYESVDSMTVSDSQETLDSVSSVVSSVSSSSSKSRKNRSAEEIAEHKQEALERKAQKQKERLEKKTEKAKELAKRKALQELKKSSRPEECMKYVTALVDPAVLESSGGGEVLAKLQSLECKTELRAQPMTNTISWTRDNIDHQLMDDLQLQSFTTQTQEDVILIVIPTSDFVEMISNYRKEKSIGCCDSDDLRSFAQEAKKKYPEKTVTMVTIAMERYFRHQKTLQNRNFRAACLGTDASTKQTKTKKIKKVEDITNCVTRLEVEEALVDLQLQEGCILKMIETTTELGDMVAMYTKAVAETPFKRERDKATFSFHVDTEWAGGVKIGKDGKGLLRLWRQQIQQFRNVSPEIAQAVVAEYPSPQLLLQAYSQCDSPQEAEKLLEDIMVRRGTGVLSRSRRVGKELSRRIYIQMTSRDNSQILH